MPGPLATTVPFGFDFDPGRFMRAYRALGACRLQFYRNESRPPTARDALETARAAEMPFDSIHGLFGEHLDPTGPSPEHTAHCLSVYEQEGRLAIDLGGPMVVVHPSGWTPARAELTPDQAAEAAGPRRPRLDAFMRRLADTGERLSVTYLIENQPYNCYLGHDPVGLAAQVAAVGSRRIRMCYDTGHAHITGDVYRSLATCAPVIDYLHVHDNNGTQDAHLMPGAPGGTIDWPRLASVIQAAAISAPRMLEVFETEAQVERRAEDKFGRRLHQWLDCR
ncbi:MAG: sugar phosphate isomerase/epimerase [Phycisphaerales bacterium]|nr:sugar phosphate isomerase/epimerase [Phycisphaerales bacterium]